jgi:hypothetical protein
MWRSDCVCAIDEPERDATKSATVAPKSLAVGSGFTFQVYPTSAFIGLFRAQIFFPPSR